MAKRADVQVNDDGGRTIRLAPITAKGLWFLAHRLADDAPREGRFYVVERPYVGPIVDSIKAEGLTMRLA